MARHNGERKMGLQIARQTAAIERMKVDMEVLERELVFARSHLAHHHPPDGPTCGWERDFMIRLDQLIKDEKENAQ